MPIQWYCKVMGEEIGPLSAKELRQMAMQRQISPDDYVKKGSQGSWVRAENVKRLFDEPRRAEAVPKPTNTPARRWQLVEDYMTSQAKPTRSRACVSCGGNISSSTGVCRRCGRPSSKNRIVAICLAWLLGLTGAHKFYLGKYGQGVLYLLGTFSIALVPIIAILAIADGFRYLFAADADFARTNQESDWRGYRDDRSGLNWGRISTYVLIGTVVTIFAHISDPGSNLNANRKRRRPNNGSHQVAASSGTVIGRWMDTNVGIEHEVTIFEKNGKLWMRMRFLDGSQREVKLIEKRSSYGRRFEELKHSSRGDHWLLDSNGDLQLRDIDGLISIALKL